MTDTDLSRCLRALTSAKNDNEKFAALLMISKITKGSNCDGQTRHQILEAIGCQFLSRLLRTRNVPEGCSPSIYRSIALGILSALCSDPQMALQPVVTGNLAILNEIVISNPSDSNEMEQNIVKDCYDCLNALVVSVGGREHLVRGRTVPALCEAVVSHCYGHEKAFELLCYLLHTHGSGTWEGSLSTLHKLLLSVAQEFRDNQDTRKFELCQTLILMLSSVPQNMIDITAQLPWMDCILTGLLDIFKSKLGPAQREPAIKLTSVLVDVMGMKCLLPPRMDNVTLLLLVTHLCCIEVRMILEDRGLDEISPKSGLLCACYSLLENIIGHMTTGSSLMLDEKQVLQLHAAMVGAFNAVLYYLTRVSYSEDIQPTDPVVVASVRVLGAWLAEETAALKEETYSLLPFLVSMCKRSIHGEEERQEVMSSKCTSCTAYTKQHLSSDCPKLQTVNSVSETANKELPIQPASGSDQSGSDRSGSEQSESVPVSPSTAKQSESLQDTCTDKSELDFQQTLDTDQLEAGSLTAASTDQPEAVSQPTARNDQSEIESPCDVNQSENVSDCSATSEVETLQSEFTTKCSTGSDLDDGSNVKSVKFKTSSEPQCSISSVDILQFLLPGFCHLTAEDKSREILLSQSAHVTFCQYYFQQWKKFVHSKSDTDIKSSLVTLCNIFMNLCVLERELVTSCLSFHRLLDSVLTAVPVMVYEVDHQLLWVTMAALGLMLLQYQSDRTDLDLASRSQFFTSVINFLSGVYTVRLRKKQPVLTVCDAYKADWDQMSQLWFLSVQALCACIPLYTDVIKQILKSGWLPAIIKTFQDVQGREVDEETRVSVLSLLSTLAQNVTCRQIILEKGGLELARLYSSADLREALTKSS